MNIIETIRAEILRLIETEGAQVAIGKVLTILDIIEEQPVNLMAEIKQYYSDNFDLINGDNPTLNIVTHIACHFFALGRQSKQTGFPTTDEEMEAFLATHPNVEAPDKYKTPDWLFKQEQPACEGLEEEITTISKNEYFDFSDWKAIARHFAQWQKERDKVKNTEIARRAIDGYKEEMMKEAVEGTIVNACYPTKIETNSFYSKFEHGQKVKLIIIKED